MTLANFFFFALSISGTRHNDWIFKIKHFFSTDPHKRPYHFWVGYIFTRQLESSRFLRWVYFHKKQLRLIRRVSHSHTVYKWTLRSTQSHNRFSYSKTIFSLKQAVAILCWRQCPLFYWHTLYPWCETFKTINIAYFFKCTCFCVYICARIDVCIIRYMHINSNNNKHYKSNLLQLTYITKPN